MEYTMFGMQLLNMIMTIVIFIFIISLCGGCR